jgi:hypothetical protein
MSARGLSPRRLFCGASLEVACRRYSATRTRRMASGSRIGAELRRRSSSGSVRCRCGAGVEARLPQGDRVVVGTGADPGSRSARASALMASLIAHRASRDAIREFAPGIDRQLPPALLAPPAFPTLGGWIGGADTGLRLGYPRRRRSADFCSSRSRSARSGRASSNCSTRGTRGAGRRSAAEP